MHSDHFAAVFLRADAPVQRAKFLSRAFGIFSEEIVRIWATHPDSPYENLGRPTLVERRTSGRGSTLDFTLRERATGLCFASEMKCEIEYERFRYLTLTEVSQLAHHKRPAFPAFLRACQRDPTLEMRVGGEPIALAGGILIWGAATAEGRALVMDHTGAHDVLTVAGIVEDLRQWKCEAFNDLLESRRRWFTEMTSELLSGELGASAHAGRHDGN